MATETLPPRSAVAATVTGLADDVLCAHCGLPVPRGLIDHRATEQFCCAGCETAFAIIHEGGLDSYYAIRDQCPVRPQSVPADSEEVEQFDDPSLIERRVVTETNGYRRVRLGLAGLHCAACVWLVEKTPRVVPGLLDARVNLVRSTVELTWDPARVRLSEIATVLGRLGYRPHLLEGKSDDARDAEGRQRLLRLAIAGACAGNAMLIALALYAGMFSTMAAEHLLLFRAAGTAIGVVAIVWPGSVFFRGAWNAIRLRTPHIDIPVALGLGVGGIAGVVNTLTGRGEVYFDTLALLVFLLLLGRYLQWCGQKRALDRVSLLHALTPRLARRCNSDGTVRSIAASSLNVGDVVEVRAGETIPADGVVVEGGSTIDESLLTGESAGRPVACGDEVAAGSSNQGARLRITVRAVGTESRLGKIMGLVEAASRDRPPIVQFADRISGWFVGVVLTLAAITLAIWWSSDSERAIEHAVALLIVACPCALGLATPLTLAVAQGRAAARSILVKNSGVLERLAVPGQVWLDKTGTLTEGEMRLREWIGPEEIKPLVAALEVQVAHPIAAALVRSLGVSSAISECVRTTVGGGVSGIVDGRKVVVGSLDFVQATGALPNCEINHFASESLEKGWTPILIAVDGEIVAAAAIGDQLRADAAAAVATLQQKGWKVGILSGDHPAVVAAVARQVGIASDQAIGGLTPEEKLERVEASRVIGTVLMAGDGVNDSAALAAAHIGVAVHGGAEVSLRAADVYTGRPGLTSLIELTQAGRRTVRIIRGNFAASLSYNIIAVGLAMAGLINPLVAAVLMPISSLTVLAFALGGRTFTEARPFGEIPQGGDLA